jgi:hypothetical protein
MRARRLNLLLALALYATAAPAAAADAQEALTRARSLYNERRFDAALEAAEEGRQAPELADSADLIAARAYLERFRESASPEDLASARERLRRIDPARFDQMERTEFIIGLGEALFLEEAPGAAAAVFASVLDGPGVLAPDAHERLLDWWASAQDRDARPQPDIERRAVYDRIRSRMQTELSVNPASSVALYWLAAAARGQGNLDEAWNAAQAAWVRAPLASDRGAMLRGELDRLVKRGIVPDRARITAQPPETLLMEWELFKEKWSR